MLSVPPMLFCKSRRLSGSPGVRTPRVAGSATSAPPRLDGEQHRVARLQLANRLDQTFAIGDHVAIDVRDNVVHLHARLFVATPRKDLIDAGTFGVFLKLHARASRGSPIRRGETLTTPTAELAGSSDDETSQLPTGGGSSAQSTTGKLSVPI